VVGGRDEQRVLDMDCAVDVRQKHFVEQLRAEGCGYRGAENLPARFIMHVSCLRSYTAYHTQTFGSS
jgi:hypothetical protein